MYVFSNTFFFMQHAHNADSFPAWDCLQHNYLRRNALTSFCSYVPILSTVVGIRTLYNMRKLHQAFVRRTGGFLCQNDPNIPCNKFPCSIIRKEWPQVHTKAMQEVFGIKALVCLGSLILKIFRAVKAFFHRTFSPSLLPEQDASIQLPDSPQSGIPEETLSETPRSS
ncbi:hypothetical protein L11322_00019 [Chlamydia trachomatis L1/1322/p2]|nr:hypothetical protein CTLINITIAL_01445 [Chlamydia trachomatis L2/434/Bu(i)]AGJ65309.2 hypothetical protein CTLFINAL_01445 [Chlamydia trachomatis L2/434/Bu(f)]AKC30257.1 hypothetical protein L2bCS78408_01460 [Chlamydia trachomatis]CCP51310.1 hypothetical protein L2B8200_00019 [Chlamydia trachomatis L2b/8200/07]CCP61163.1 hypothetical protein L2B795_00019 [Chlamydia trachomatis L2b/795]CCP62054.1 hypothetical protein L1440_00019 [Chlamydia trachomatis L1/440/LN]CCP62946.1 hypothetical protein